MPRGEIPSFSLQSTHLLHDVGPSTYLLRAPECWTPWSHFRRSMLLSVQQKRQRSLLMKLLGWGETLRKHRAEFHGAVWELCRKGGGVRNPQLSREGALTARRLKSITHLEAVLGSLGPCVAEPGSRSSHMALSERAQSSSALGGCSFRHTSEKPCL